MEPPGADADRGGVTEKDLTTELSRLNHSLATLQERYHHDIAMLEVELAAAEASRRDDEGTTLLSEASFGAFDGMTSVSGVVFALLHRPISSIAVAAAGLALASAIGMGAGEYLGDTKTKGSLRRSLVMAGATAVGTLAPTIPFFACHSKTLALVISGIVAFVMATAIGAIRAKAQPLHKARGYVQTYAILAGAVIATVLLAFALPGSTA